MQRWTCASCEHPLMPGFAWKQGEHFYCSEFCAEAEELEAPTLAPASPDTLEPVRLNP